jgi:hypothetical protein
MSMRGRRFGMGLAVGVLFGVVVVAMSGGLGASLISFAPATNSSATSVTTTAATTTFTTESIGLVTTPQGTTTQGSSGQNATLYVTSSVSTTTSPTVPSVYFNSISALPSSRIAAVAVQNPASNAFLVVPVVVAFLLGAALYRTSTKGKVAGDKEEQKES